VINHIGGEEGYSITHVCLRQRKGSKCVSYKIMLLILVSTIVYTSTLIFIGRGLESINGCKTCNSEVKDLFGAGSGEMVLNMQCFMPHFSIDNTLPKYSWLMMIMV
jgi:hypothetical protein